MRRIIRAFRYVGEKRKIKEIVPPLIKKLRKLMTTDMNLFRPFRGTLFITGSSLLSPYKLEGGHVDHVNKKPVF